jgi:PKD repeat protein
MNNFSVLIKRGMLPAFLVCFLSFLTANAQTGIPFQLPNNGTGTVQYDHCGIMYADSVLRAAVPGAPTLLDFEGWLQKEIVKQKQIQQNKSGRAAIITIPVVVHIIHNGDAVGSNENIAASRVISQINILNQDFRRRNADTVNTPVGFRPVAADVEIEFCLALRDPSGNVLAEPGIHRVQRTETNWSSTTTIDNTLKPATIWDPNQYFNMWSVDFGGNGLLGYAQFPEGSGLAGMPAGAQSANSDGVVVVFSSFGASGAANAPYNLGRTMSHEVGHWLGLRHIWGDGGCTVDDFCNDTPVSDAANRGCTASTVSCGTTDMVQNYMDYTNDACMNIFTQDQKTRMQTVMAVCPRRASLLNSTVCTPLIQVALTGQVRDAGTLVGVPNARVRILGVGNNFSYTATCDANGNFTISVNQGTYNIYGGKWGYVTAEVANRTFTAPSVSVTVDIAKGYYDDFIMDFGWTVTGTATTGDWERGAPVGTLNGTAQSNAGADVTNDFGSDAYVTGNGGGAAGTDDVDGGTAILTSPVFDLTTYNLPYLSYYRWWFNDGGSGNFDDTLVISVSNGTTSVVIDRIGPGTNSGNSWTFRNYNLNTLIAKSANMRFVVTTGDYGAGHLVEAGLDLFKVVDSLTIVNQPPTPLFTSTSANICVGQTVTYTDQSAGSPTSRLWTFQGGTPATSTAANPTVTYAAAGTYNVTLASTNSFGTNTIAQTGYVTVTTAQTNFTANVTQGCGTLAVQFTDQSSCNPSAWSWSFPGGTPATSTAQNPTVTYSSPGNYDVSLTVNGITNTQNGYITIGTNGNLLSEDFESNSFVTNGWTLQNPDNGITWAISTVAGNAPGTRSAGINLFNYTTNGQRDGLISPVLNLSSVSNTVLTFKHAHRRRTQTQRDSLIVYVSTDGGATWPNRVLATGENGTGSFATNSTTNGPEFIPTIADDWCGQGTVGAGCFTINLGAFDGQSNVRIRFESFNNLGNNIYLDDIVVSGCQLVPTLAPVAAFVASPTTACGSATVQFTDQSTNGPSSWEWSFPGGTPATSALQNPSISYTTPGVYSVTLIAINSAGRDTLVRQSYITINEIPTLSVLGNNPLCAGQSNGVASATGSGGSAPYTFAWSNGNTSANASGLGTGIYSVTLTDNKGCSVTGSTTLTAPLAITATATNTPAFCGNANGSASLSITGGTPPFTINWNNGGSGASLTGLTSGTYSYTVTDNNGCTRTGSTTVAANNSGPSLAFNIQNATCNGSANGSITATVTGGSAPYAYAWGNGGQTNSINNLAAGNYSITVTDANGCTVSTTVFVSAPAVIAITATTSPATCGNNNGSVSASVSGGTSPYTYAWSSGGNTATINNLASGSYTVTVIDSRSCTATATFNVSNVGGPSVTTSKKDVSCNGGNNGTATAAVTGGTPPYVLNWSNGAAGTSLTNLVAGTYTVTVTDASGCASLATVIIGQPAAIVAAINAINSACGATNGSATATATGGTAPYTYSWSNGGATATISNLAAGIYTVTISDANLCTGTAAVTVTQLLAPVVSIAKVDVSCFGANDGAATATVTGGATPYTFAWNGGLNGQAVTGLLAGNYSLTVTDANNCITITNVAIAQPTEIVIGNTVTDATCGNADGEIATSISGGSAPYSYLWGSGQVSTDLINLVSGAYQLTVSDQNGCYADTVIVVSNIGGPSVTLNVVGNNCNGQNNGSITAVVTGGAAPYTYIWSNGATVATASNLASGAYTVSVTDATGCVAVRTATISQPSQLQVQAYHVDASCGISNGQAGVLAAGGIAPYNYLWSNGSTLQQLQNLPQGVYSITVTDANNCNVSLNVLVDSLALLDVVANVSAETCPGAANGAINVAVNSGVAPFTFTWSNGFNTQNGSGLASGTYNITVTDASGCVSTLNLNVPAATPMVLNGSVIAIVCGSKVGEVEVAVTGGIAPYDYVWSTTDTGQSIFVVFDGNYAVTVTDANGCQQTTSVFVPRGSGPLLTTYVTPDTLNASNGTATTVPSNGNAPFIYEWSDGQTTATAAGLAAGTYVVTVTDADGCATTDTVNIGLYTSLTEVIGDANVSLWPNPTSGKFTINFINLAGVADITVFDALGKLVMTQENDILAHPSVEVDLSSFAGGVYMVRINHNGQMLHYRLVLAK